MREIKHMLYTDARGEVAIIFPKIKSSKTLSGKIINKNNDLEYEFEDVFVVRESGHFNDQWYIPISREIMDSIGAKHKYDLRCEFRKK